MGYPHANYGRIRVSSDEFSARDAMRGDDEFLPTDPPPRLCDLRSQSPPSPSACPYDAKIPPAKRNNRLSPLFPFFLRSSDASARTSPYARVTLRATSRPVASVVTTPLRDPVSSSVLENRYGGTRAMPQTKIKVDRDEMIPRRSPPSRRRRETVRTRFRVPISKERTRDVAASRWTPRIGIFGRIDPPLSFEVSVNPVSLILIMEDALKRASPFDSRHGRPDRLCRKQIRAGSVFIIRS